MIPPLELAQHCHNLNVLTQRVVEELCYLGKHPLWWPCGPVVLSLVLEESVLFDFSLLWALSDSLQGRIFSCVLRFLCQGTRTICFLAFSLKIEQLCVSFMSHRPNLKMGQFLKSM